MRQAGIAGENHKFAKIGLLIPWEGGSHSLRGHLSHPFAGFVDRYKNPTTDGQMPVTAIHDDEKDSITIIAIEDDAMAK